MPALPYPEATGPLISVVLLGGYHLYLYLRLRKNPRFTIQALNHEARALWVQYIMEDPGRGLLGVQTLRNSTMVSTFLASTAVLLMMGSLSLISHAEDVSAIWHAFNLSGSSRPALWVGKILLLVTDFFAAFFCFAMSVRMYNHIGYQISLPRPMQQGFHAADRVAAMMNRGGRYYTLGMRMYYLAVPLVFWLFSPLLMLAATLILISILFINDRVPRNGFGPAPPQRLRQKGKPRR